MPFPFQSRDDRASLVHRKAGGTLMGDKSSWEVSLERSGDINILQRYRLLEHLHLNNQDTVPSFISHNIVFIEEDLREVVQEEISVKEELDISNQTRQWRLDVLNARYWLLGRKWWHYRSCMGDGFQLRGFELWRSHPRWYMHRVLVEDCAGRQGCCARQCGCCLNRKIDPTHKLGVGHCTLECGCCRRARGFDISVRDKKLLKEKFREEITNLARHRITQVAIWGLVGDSYDSPFNLIDAPPNYEQIAKDKT